MKRKQLTALVLAMLMLLSLIPALSAADDAFPETYTSTGCDKDPVRQHRWKLQSVTKNPTCTEKGSAVYQCENCGQTTTRTADALGGQHDWCEWDDIVEATCTTAGYLVRYCNRCMEEQFKTVPAQHRYGEWEVVKPASLTRSGEWKRTCAVCGNVETRVVDPLIQRKAYALELILSPAPTDEDKIPYGEILHSADDEPTYREYRATLVNTGLNPITVREYSVFPNQNAQQLEFPIKLDVGSSVTISIPVAYIEAQIDKTEAGRGIVGTLKPEFCFYGEAGGQQVCSSNTVAYRYTVTDEEGYTPWKAPAVTTASSIAVNTFTISTPRDPNGFTEGEYVRFNYTVQNVSSEQLDVELWDPLISAERPIRTFTLAAGATRSAAEFYVVTEADVIRGYALSCAYVLWTDPGSGEAMRADSNEFSLAMNPEPKEKLDMGIGAEAPENDAFFVAGEKAKLAVEFVNNDTVAYENVVVYSPQNAKSSVPVATIDRIEPGWHRQFYEYQYTVRETDAAIGYAMCIAYGTAERVAEDGTRTTVELTDCYVLDCGIYGNSGEEYVRLTRTEVSKPQNGSYYVEGETVSYLTTATVLTDFPIDEIAISDSLESFDVTFNYQEEVQNVQPGASVTYTSNHKVTAEEAAAGELSSFSGMWFIVEGEEYFLTGEFQDFTYTMPQTVKTGTARRVARPTVISRPGRFGGIAKADGDCGWRIARVSGTNKTYTLAQCAAHQTVANKVAQLLQDAADKNDEGLILAYRNAQRLWSDELDAQYFEAIGVATSEQTIVLLRDRSTSRAYLEKNAELLRAVYAETPVVAEQKITERWENRCAELCYDLHHPEEDRPDSIFAEGVAESEGEDEPEEFVWIGSTVRRLISEARTDAALANAFRAAQELWQSELDQLMNRKYDAADATTQKAILADRIAFDNYFAAHREVLAMLYVEQPQIVEETLTAMLETKTAETLALGE